jgi:hypothetical protein
MTQAESYGSEIVAEEKAWLLVKLALSIVRPLAIVGILFSIVVITGYFAHIEALYRPVSGGPATNPLTAVRNLLSCWWTQPDREPSVSQRVSVLMLKKSE